MFNWDEVRGNIQTIGARIASLEEVDPNLREALVLMIGMIMPIGDAVYQGRQETQAMGDTINQLQGRVDNTTQRSGSTRRRLGILESRAAADIETLASGKTAFRSWNEKLINVFSQARQGCRGMFRSMAEYVDQDVTGDFETLFRNTQSCRDMESQGSSYGNISEDLYILLVDKTEGEAMVRLQGCSHGDGVSAYMTIYKWFTGASEQAVAERIRKLMSPPTPKKEQDVADAMDRWIESARTLENMKPEYKLQDPFEVTALESVMNIGQGKTYFENLKVQGLESEEILARCKDHAILKRLDHAHEKHQDDMDVGAVQIHAETHQDWSQEWNMGGDCMSPENHWSDMGVDTMGKEGKKGSKGYKGKGKGIQGACYHCGHYGHAARECGEMNPFQGACTKCGQWGHTARDCRVGGRMQEIRQDTEESGEEQGEDHGRIGILEMDGGIRTVDRDWRKDEGGCSANADEQTQVRRSGVCGSLQLEHSGDDMPPSQEWAYSPQKKTSLSSRGDRDTRPPPSPTVGDFIEAAEKKRFSALGDVMRIRDGEEDLGDTRCENCEVVKATADSGAVDHVAPGNTDRKVRTRDIEASRRGMHYSAANGTRIMNQGEKTISGIVEEKVPLNMTWQVAEVEKPLASIGRICDAGNVAVFTKEGGYIVGRKTAETFIGQLQKSRQPKMQMKRENGVYQFKLYVEKDTRDNERSRFGRDMNVISESYSRRLEEYSKDFPRLGN